MSARLVDGIQAGAEQIAAALFGVAAALALHARLSGAVGQLELCLLAAAAGGGAFLLARAGIRAAPSSRRAFPLPRFDPLDYDFVEAATSGEDQPIMDELVLTDADRVDAAVDPEEPLLLEDVLAEIGPDARVVRLFDRKAMPTPGQLRSRIENHLLHGRPAAEDASQALSEALDELRRSLR